MHPPATAVSLSISVETAYNYPVLPLCRMDGVSVMDFGNSLIRPGTGRLGAAFSRAHERFIRIRGNPKEIALGLALGIFVGVSPLFGFQLLSAVFAAAMLRWNKIAAAIGTLISNPFTTPFIYTLAYYVGTLVMGNPAKGHLVIPRDLETAARMLEETPRILLTLTVGTVLIGLPLAAAGYFLAYAAVSRYRERIKQKLAMRREKADLRREKLRERSSRLKERIRTKVASRRKKNRLTGKSRKRSRRT